MCSIAQKVTDMNTQPTLTRALCLSLSKRRWVSDNWQPCLQQHVFYMPPEAPYRRRGCMVDSITDGMVTASYTDKDNTRHEITAPVSEFDETPF